MLTEKKGETENTTLHLAMIIIKSVIYCIPNIEFTLTYSLFKHRVYFNIQFILNIELT